jgi:hypothetical protein
MAEQSLSRSITTANALTSWVVAVPFLVYWIAPTATWARWMNYAIPLDLFFPYFTALVIPAVYSIGCTYFEIIGRKADIGVLFGSLAIVQTLGEAGSVSLLCSYRYR